MQNYLLKCKHNNYHIVQTVPCENNDTHSKDSFTIANQQSWHLFLTLVLQSYGEFHVIYDQSNPTKCKISFHTILNETLKMHVFTFTSAWPLIAFTIVEKNVKMIWKTLLIGLSTTNFTVRGLIWILNGKTIRFALQTQLETSIHLLMMDSGSKRVTFLKSRETTSPRPSSRLLNPIINPSYFSLHVNGQTNRPHLLWLIVLFQITTWCSTL